jgi:hypothetical protein
MMHIITELSFGILRLRTKYMFISIKYLQPNAAQNFITVLALLGSKPKKISGEVCRTTLAEIMLVYILFYFGI